VSTEIKANPRIMSRLVRPIRSVLEYMTARDLSDPQLLARVLTVLKCQAAFGPILREVAGDDDLLSAAAAASYAHGNGFTKIVLTRGEHWALRLHIHDTRAGAYHVHDHRWPFASAILRGNLQEDRFVVDPAEGPPTSSCRWLHFRYSVGPEPEWSATPMGDEGGGVSLRLLSRLDHPAGSVYAIGTRELHALPPTRDACSTLVLTGTARSDSCNLYSMPGVAPQSSTPKAGLAKDVIARMLLAEAEAVQ
jgi:hypothetical protein